VKIKIDLPPNGPTLDPAKPVSLVVLSATAPMKLTFFATLIAMYIIPTASYGSLHSWSSIPKNSCVGKLTIIFKTHPPGSVMPGGWVLVGI
jgi:hypothetical protein